MNPCKEILASTKTIIPGLTSINIFMLVEISFLQEVKK